VLEVQEEERKRLAREFHDEVGQIFTALRLDLVWIRTRLKPGQGELQEKIRTMDTLIDESIRKVRQIARTLRPDILDSEGLVAAVRGLVHDFEIHSGIETRLDAPEELVVEPAVATVVFRVIQEALTNVARHSEATLTEVRLSREENALVARVCDNGKGIDQERLATRRSLGLRGMQERAKLVGGEIVIASLKPTGTEIQARIPI
jgi:signal transduction histidine kinase